MIYPETEKTASQEKNDADENPDQRKTPPRLFSRNSTENDNTVTSDLPDSSKSHIPEFHQQQE